MSQKFPHLIQKYSFYAHFHACLSLITNEKWSSYIKFIFISLSPFSFFFSTITTISIHLLFYLEDKLENFLHSQHHHYLYWGRERDELNAILCCALLNIMARERKIIIIILYRKRSCVCRENMQMLSPLTIQNILLCLMISIYQSNLIRRGFLWKCFFTIEKLSDWGRVSVYSSLISIMNLKNLFLLIL